MPQENDCRPSLAFNSVLVVIAELNVYLINEKRALPTLISHRYGERYLLNT